MLPRLPMRAMNRYVARVMAAGTHSVPAWRRLIEVMGLTPPPQSLFAPRVIAAALRGRSATAAAGPQAAVLAPVDI